MAWSLELKKLPALAAVAFVLSLAIAPGAFAQTPPQPFAEQSQKLDSAAAILAQVEQTLARKDLSDAELSNLRSQIDALPDNPQSVIAVLQPQLDAIKTRLAQLGPKPAAGASPEGADIAADRDQQQKQYDAIDALLKRAALVATQIEQDTNAITSRRREIFTRALVQRTTSVADPRLWIAVASEAPRDLRASRVVAGDWTSSIAAKLDGSSLTASLGALLALALACALATRLARRVNPRDPATHDPSPLRRATAAAWCGLVDAATPIAAAAAVYFLLESLDLFGRRMEPLALAAMGGVVRVALALSISRALFAPGLPNWRPLAMSEASAARLCRLAAWLAVVVTVGRILEAWLDVIGAGLRSTIALRDVASLAAAAVAGLALRHFSPRPATADDDDCLPPIVDGSTDWRGPLRAAAWGVVALVAGATLAGYSAFASFLVDQALWVAFVGASILLARGLGEQAIARFIQPEARIGRAVMSGAGLARDSLEQIAVVLSGALTVAAWLAATTLILAPWGVESDDMFGGVRAALFGFKVGEVTISLSSILVALAVFALTLALARGLQNWLETKYLPRTRLDSGLRNSIRTSVGYMGALGAAALSMGYLGLSFEKLAIVAGALSVGIGFGLQSIVNNFVSGLILLWERAIRVGDWVVVGDEQGYVRRINVRSTEIETFDRAMMIVPNSNLVSGVVKNWVRNDRVGRVKNPVAVSLDTDPAAARAAMLASLEGIDVVQKFPAPMVLFNAMDTALRLELVYFVGDIEKSARVKSDVNFEIYRRLKDKGIAPYAAPPVAPTRIELVDIDRVENAFARASNPRGG